MARPKLLERDKRRKTPGEYLVEATTEELLAELTHRRRDALMDCPTQDIEAELTNRGVERFADVGMNDAPPRLVEK